MATQNLQNKRERETNNITTLKEAKTIPPPPPSPSHTHDFSFTLPPPHPPSNSEHAAPADDIFLHGHLLPLNTIPPRPDPRVPPDRVKGKETARPNTALSSFLGLENWRRRSRTTAEDKNKNTDRNKNKKAFDAGRLLLKKYASVVESFLFFFKKDKEATKRGVVRRPYSFSGRSDYIYAKGKNKKKRTVQASAPASMRTSPANSGHLAGAPTTCSSSSDKSSMEELQSAIQAAIAHCKSSIAEKGEV